MPSGLTVYYRDSDHSYWLEVRERGGKWTAVRDSRVTNVTTILGVLAKDALLDWAANLAREGEDWREVRREAAERGTSSHDIVMRTLLGQRTSLADMDDEHRPYGQAAFRWMRERRPVLKAAESIVVSSEHRYAGRFDLLTTDNVLCDLKTVSKWAERNGRRLPPYPENCLQLDLYAQAMVESGFDRPEHGVVVRLGPDGTWDEHPVELDPQRGLDVLAAYRARAAATKALRAGLPKPEALAA